MMLKKRLLCIAALVGLALSGSALAVPKSLKMNPPKPKTPSQQQGKGQWSKEKGACSAQNAHIKEFLAQQKQLQNQAREKEGEEKSLLAQARQIEAQREALEHAHRLGQHGSGTEAEIKAKEQERVNLEHQATERSKEREQLLRQAHELDKERLAAEQQHKQECGGGSGHKHLG